MARAGLGDDLLLANETVDPARLEAMAALGDTRSRRGRLARPRSTPPRPPASARA